MRRRTKVTVQADLVQEGRWWCEQNALGFGRLLELALPAVEAVRVEPGAREVVQVRVDEDLWARELARWAAAPGAVADSALRAFLRPTVPFDVHVSTGDGSSPGS